MRIVSSKTAVRRALMLQNEVAVYVPDIVVRSLSIFLMVRLSEVQR